MTEPTPSKHRVLSDRRRTGVMLVVFALLASLAIRLEMTRDRDILDRSGAIIAPREDGSPAMAQLRGDGVTDDNAGRLGELESLGTLTIEGGHLTADGLRGLAPLVDLTRLTFRDVEWPVNTLAALPAFPKLRSLEIDGCGHLTMEDMQAIARQSNLESLRLANVTVPEQWTQALLTLTSLRVLAMSEGPLLTPAEIATLSDLQSLRDLHLEAKWSSPETVEAIRAAVPNVVVTSAGHPNE